MGSGKDATPAQRKHTHDRVVVLAKFNTKCKGIAVCFALVQ